MAASVGLVSDQAAVEQLEETKVSTVIKQNGEGSVSGTKEVAGQDEVGKLGIGSVEETEVKNSDTAVEVNKVEESDQGFCSDVLATDGLEVLKDPRREYDDLTPPQSAIEDNGEELKNKSYLSDTHEPPSEAEDKSTDDLIPSIVQEPGSEAAKEPAFSESMIQELKSEEKEISAAPSLVSDTESKPVEPRVITAVTEPTSVFEIPIAAEEISAAPSLVSGKESKPVELPTVSVEPASSVIEIPTAVKDISAAPSLVSDTESKPVELPIVSAVIEPASSVIQTPTAVEEISTAPSLVTDTAIEPMEPPTISADVEPASNVIETPVALESSAISQDENSLVQVEEILESKKEEVVDLTKLDGENKNVQETVASGTSEAVDKLDESREVDIPDASDKLELGKTRADHDADEGMEKYVDNSEDSEMEKSTIERSFNSVLPNPSAVALTECIADPQFTIEEEKQEKTIEVEETSLNERIAGEVADISSEGKMTSRGIEMVERKLQESLEGSKTAMVITSEDLESAKTILEVPPENERSSGGIQISKEKNDNSFEDEKFTSPETLRCHDATVEVEVSLSEGANTSKDVGMGEEKKDKSLEGVESTLIETSKDVPTTQVAEVLYEAEKASKIAERAEEQGESLGGEMITSPKTTKYLLKRATTKYYDAEDAELSSAEDGIVSEYVEMVEENTKSYEGGNRTSIDTSKDLDLDQATEVAEFSTEVEKASKTVKRNTEDVSFVTDKATLIGTSKDLHASTEVPEVLFEEEKASRNVEMDKGNNETSEGDKEMILSGTFEEANATTVVAEAASEVEKDSGGSTMIRGKDENLEDDKKQTLVETSKDQDAASEFPDVLSKGEKVCGSTEERGERLGSDGTTIRTTKECNVEEKDVVATPAKEPVGGAEEAESEFKPSEVIQIIKDGTEIEGSGVKKGELKESEGQNPTISSKNGGDTTEKEAPEQVHIKSVERRSGRIISKVKKSIVKVKKAIFGKSPRSKTIASEG